MFEFTCQYPPYYIEGFGYVYAVDNPHDCTDFNHLIGATVKINGKEHVVRAVERFAKMSWKKGESIGLLV